MKSYRDACAEAVQNSTPIRGGSVNLTGRLFQFLLGFGQIRQDARLHFPPDAAANETAEETAHTVASGAIDCDEPEAGSARRIGNEYPNFKGGPEVVLA